MERTCLLDAFSLEAVFFWLEQVPLLLVTHTLFFVVVLGALPKVHLATTKRISCCFLQLYGICSLCFCCSWISMSLFVWRHSRLPNPPEFSCFSWNFVCLALISFILLNVRNKVIGFYATFHLLSFFGSLELVSCFAFCICELES